jgi:phosphoserine/homoserine phosphotransferase
MAQLGYPTLFCHRLEADQQGRIVDYRIRLKDHKRQSVIAFHELNYRVIAAGDSYNDTTMLGEADVGILFKAPDNVIREFPQFASVSEYADLKAEFIKASKQRIAP